MGPIRARVANGRLIVDEPTDLPEGMVLDLVVDDEGDDLMPEERMSSTRRSCAGGSRWSEAGGSLRTRSFESFALALDDREARPIAPEAREQAWILDAWWRENRPSATELFHAGLAAALSIRARFA